MAAMAVSLLLRTALAYTITPTLSSATVLCNRPHVVVVSLCYSLIKPTDPTCQLPILANRIAQKCP